MRPERASTAGLPGRRPTVRNQIQGRQVQARFLRSRALQPAMLNMTVDADLDASVVIG